VTRASRLLLLAALTAGVVSAHPGDRQAEAQRACQEMAALAPDGLDEGELSPCHRD